MLAPKLRPTVRFPRLLPLLALPTLLTLEACSGGDDGDGGAAEGSFSVALTGAETGAWTGEASFRDRQGFVNNTSRWTIDLETGDVGDEALLINLITSAEGAGEYPPTGTYELGQFTPGTGNQVLFGEFYAVDAPDYTWVDNPGTIDVTRAGDGVIAGAVEASIQNNATGGFTTFRGSFTAMRD